MLKVGTKIIILQDNLQLSDVKKGDKLEIINCGLSEIMARSSEGLDWCFHPKFLDIGFALCTDMDVAQVTANAGKMTLPIDSNARKDYPLFRGVLRYFPAALAGVAKTSKLGNDKHNPGEEMHHARGKSTDQGDCIMRHLADVEDLLAAMKRGDSSVTPEVVLNEVNQMAWRALAFSQELHEQFGAPLAPGAKK